MSTNKSSGFSIVEIIVAAAIIATIVGTAAGAFSLYLRLSGNNAERTQAALLTEEASEALQFLRDKSWTENIASLPLETNIYIYWDGNKYITSTDPNASEKYFVSIYLTSIFRDLNGDITEGGTLDPRTKKIKIAVSRPWATSTPILETQMLLHDIHKN